MIKDSIALLFNILAIQSCSTNRQQSPELKMIDFIPRPNSVFSDIFQFNRTIRSILRM
jgi:hypothetical protein